MKIACLQFAPRLGDVQANIARADQLLKDAAAELASATENDVLWLVLPEMALSGYNFSSKKEITPFLEPKDTGISTLWAQQAAQRYNCYVTVGYPEICPTDPTARAVSPAQHQGNGATSPLDSEISSPHQQPCYNSTVTVRPTGTIIAHVRKHFLYYTDELWAHPGTNPNLTHPSPNPTPGSGFFSHDFSSPSSSDDPLGRVSMGICMDINPHLFTAPWTSYEFAHHVLDSKTPLTVLSMAWLSRLTDLEINDDATLPDDETFVYWIERFHPLRQIANTTSPSSPIPTTSPSPLSKTDNVVVFANRCGVEGSAVYAGTSAVVRFTGGEKVEILDVCGRNEERVMLVDLDARPKFALQRGGGAG